MGEAERDELIVVTWKRSSIEGLYVHTPSGRYYARISVDRKRTFRSLGTNVYTIATIKMAKLKRDLLIICEDRQTAKDRLMTGLDVKTNPPWKGVPDEVWSVTIELPSIMTACRGVYLLSRNSELVYIGKGKNVHARIASHIDDDLLRKDFDAVRVIPCLMWDRRRPDVLSGLSKIRYESIAQLEDVLIRWLRPEYNRRVVTSPTNLDPKWEFSNLMRRVQIDELLVQAS